MSATAAAAVVRAARYRRVVAIARRGCRAVAAAAATVAVGRAATAAGERDGQRLVDRLAHPRKHARRAPRKYPVAAAAATAAAAAGRRRRRRCFCCLLDGLGSTPAAGPVLLAEPVLRPSARASEMPASGSGSESGLDSSLFFDLDAQEARALL